MALASVDLLMGDIQRRIIVNLSAMTAEKERIGAELNANKEKSPAELFPAVKADIDLFVNGAPQFDDITMLCLEYKSAMEAENERTDD